MNNTTSQLDTLLPRTTQFEEQLKELGIMDKLKQFEADPDFIDRFGRNPGAWDVWKANS